MAMADVIVIGDLVVINLDDSIVYTVLSIYGTGFRSAMCSYTDKADSCVKELSIPLVALTRYENHDTSDGKMQLIPAA